MSHPLDRLVRYFDIQKYYALVAQVNEAVQQGRWDPDGIALGHEAYKMYHDAVMAEREASGLKENEFWQCDDEGNRVGKLIVIPCAADVWNDTKFMDDNDVPPKRCGSCGEWLPMRPMWGVGNRLGPLEFMNLNTGNRTCGKCPNQ